MKMAIMVKKKKATRCDASKVIECLKTSLNVVWKTVVSSDGL